MIINVDKRWNRVPADDSRVQRLEMRDAAPVFARIVAASMTSSLDYVDGMHQKL